MKNLLEISDENNSFGINQPSNMLLFNVGFNQLIDLGFKCHWLLCKFVFIEIKTC